jgi:hypothetical protein
MEQILLEEGRHDLVFLPVSCLYLEYVGMCLLSTFGRLLLEYSRIMSVDREAMSYEG